MQKNEFWNLQLLASTSFQWRMTASHNIFPIFLSHPILSLFYFDILFVWALVVGFVKLAKEQQTEKILQYYNFATK